MRRRDFIRAIVGSAAAWPVVARAQQSMRRVGLLLPTPESDSEEQRRATIFVEALQEQGWIDGRNVKIDYRWCSSDPARVRDSAAELVQQKPDVIVADSALAVAPLHQLTPTIPIVFLQLADPVESGFVENLARPGGNITGFTPGEFSTRAKMLELLKEVAPHVTHVGVIFNPVQAPQAGMLEAIQKTAVPLGIQVEGASAGSADEITHIFEGFVGKQDGGIIVLPNPVTIVNRNLIIELAARYHLPAAYAYSFFVRDGGLISYGGDPVAQWRQAASYVDRILKGAKPTDLPVQGPAKFEITINLKTAKALGLTVSRDLLLVADEVIE